LYHDYGSTRGLFAPLAKRLAHPANQITRFSPMMNASRTNYCHGWHYLFGEMQNEILSIGVFRVYLIA
jgi:hypothetical protein